MLTYDLTSPLGVQNCIHFGSEAWMAEHSRKSRRMPHKTSSALLYGICLLLGTLAAGCARDPLVRKQKFLEQGNRYFDKGEYPEANISYSRALQIDPRFIEAHYKLAQC